MTSVKDRIFHRNPFQDGGYKKRDKYSYQKRTQSSNWEQAFWCSTSSRKISEASVVVVCSVCEHRTIANIVVYSGI